eukprot:m.145995 g.145995  ORF g.145995 m.145995 type:complete len:989 (+) comp16797_c0_seq2:176-3142(+)
MLTSAVERVHARLAEHQRQAMQQSQQQQPRTHHIAGQARVADVIKQMDSKASEQRQVWLPKRPHVDMQDLGNKLFTKSGRRLSEGAFQLATPNREVIHMGELLMMSSLQSQRGIGKNHKDTITVFTILCNDVLLLTERRDGQYIMLAQPLELDKSTVINVFYDDNMEFQVQEKSKEGVNIFSFRAHSEEAKLQWLTLLHSQIAASQGIGGVPVSPRQNELLQLKRSNSKSDAAQKRYTVGNVKGAASPIRPRPDDVIDSVETYSPAINLDSKVNPSPLEGRLQKMSSKLMKKKSSLKALDAFHQKLMTNSKPAVNNTSDKPMPQTPGTAAARKYWKTMEEEEKIRRNTEIMRRQSVSAKQAAKQQEHMDNKIAFLESAFMQYESGDTEATGDQQSAASGLPKSKELIKFWEQLLQAGPEVATIKPPKEILSIPGAKERLQFWQDMHMCPQDEAVVSENPLSEDERERLRRSFGSSNDFFVTEATLQQQRERVSSLPATIRPPVMPKNVARKLSASQQIAPLPEDTTAEIHRSDSVASSTATTTVSRPAAVAGHARPIHTIDPSFTLAEASSTDGVVGSSDPAFLAEIANLSNATGKLLAQPLSEEDAKPELPRQLSRQAFLAAARLRLEELDQESSADMKVLTDMELGQESSSDAKVLADVSALGGETETDKLEGEDTERRATLLLEGTIPGESTDDMLNSSVEADETLNSSVEMDALEVSSAPLDDSKVEEEVVVAPVPVPTKRIEQQEEPVMERAVPQPPPRAEVVTPERPARKTFSSSDLFKFPTTTNEVQCANVPVLPIHDLSAYNCIPTEAMPAPNTMVYETVRPRKLMPEDFLLSKGLPTMGLFLDNHWQDFMCPPKFDQSDAQKVIAKMRDKQVQWMLNPEEDPLIARESRPAHPEQPTDVYAHRREETERGNRAAIVLDVYTLRNKYGIGFPLESSDSSAYATGAVVMRNEVMADPAVFKASYNVTKPTSKSSRCETHFL